jgi:hypothetical protein
MPVALPNGHYLAQQAYSLGVTIEAERAVRLMALVGRSEKHALVLGDELAHTRGSNIKKRFKPRRHNTTPGVRGTTIHGNTPTRVTVETGLDIRYQILSTGGIDLLPADQQQTNIDLKGVEQSLMAAECSESIEVQMMNQLSGYTVVNGQSEYVLSGGNLCREPDARHHIYCPDVNGTNATEAEVAAESSSTLSNVVVEEALKRSRSIDYVNWPAALPTTPWGDCAVCLCSADGMQQVKSNNTDSEIYPLTTAQLQGGLAIEDTWLWTGEGFRLGPVIYLESDYCTHGTDGAANSTSTSNIQANVKRAVLLFARAMHIDYGGAWIDGLHIGYSEFVAHRELSMQMDTMWGCIAVAVESAPNAADWERYASFVISHYSPV